MAYTTTQRLTVLIRQVNWADQDALCVTSNGATLHASWYPTQGAVTVIPQVGEAWQAFYEPGEGYKLTARLDATSRTARRLAAGVAPGDALLTAETRLHLADQHGSLLAQAGGIMPHRLPAGVGAALAGMGVWPYGWTATGALINTYTGLVEATSEDGVFTLTSPGTLTNRHTIWYTAVDGYANPGGGSIVYTLSHPDITGVLATNTATYNPSASPGRVQFNQAREWPTGTTITLTVTNMTIRAVTNQWVTDTAPIGTVVYSKGARPGRIRADGRSIDQAQFPSLHAYVGSTAPNIATLSNQMAYVRY